MVDDIFVNAGGGPQGSQRSDHKRMTGSCVALA